MENGVEELAANTSDETFPNCIPAEYLTDRKQKFNLLAMDFPLALERLYTSSVPQLWRWLPVLTISDARDTPHITQST